MNKPCTIAIAVWNKPEITAQCLESLVRHTKYPYNVLIIDNGSEEETQVFLRDFCSGKDNFRIKRFDENVGYLRAANYTLETVRTPYICLLNNDTILTDGWLAESISVLESSEDIGIVSPTSNEITGKFKKDFLSGRTKDRKRKFIEVNGCLGSCFILKQEVAARIGYFDPIYAAGYFEEVDYCFKAGAAGFRSVLALGAYIEHLSNASFSAAPKERDALWHKNRDIFESRWGKSERVLIFLKNIYGKEILAKRRTYLLKKCRARAIIELYSKDGGGWAKDLHFNIRQKHSPAYNFLALYLMIILKKKAYDTVITDVHMPSFILNLLKKRLNGFYDFAGLKTLDADADPLRGTVH